MVLKLVPTVDFNTAYGQAIGALALDKNRPDIDIRQFNLGMTALSGALTQVFPHHDGTRNALGLFFQPVQTIAEAHDRFRKFVRLLPATDESVLNAAHRINRWPDLYRLQVAHALIQNCRALGLDTEPAQAAVRSFIRCAALALGEQLITKDDLSPDVQMTIRGHVSNLKHPPFDDDEAIVRGSSVYIAGLIEVSRRYIVPIRDSAENGLEHLKDVISQRASRTDSMSVDLNPVRNAKGKSAVDSTEPLTQVNVRPNRAVFSNYDSLGYLLEQKNVGGRVEFVRTPYRIKHILGEGAAGQVVEALDTANDRDVAIKISVHSVSDQSVLAGSFEAERKITAGLPGDLVAEILTEGVTPSGHPFTVMKKLKGHPLDKIIAEGALSLLEQYDVITAILDVLAKVHDDGVAHRDLKPENIFYDATHGAKAIDFGLAYNILNQVGFEFLEGRVYGTPQYMAPEVWMGGASHNFFRQDVYALGVILYEILTGRFPYNLSSKAQNQAEKWVAILDKIHASPEGLQPSLHNEHVSEAVDKVVLKALSKDPNDRYKNAGELLAAWHHAMNEDFHAIEPQVSGLGQRLTLWGSRLLKQFPRLAKFIGR